MARYDQLKQQVRDIKAEARGVQHAKAAEREVRRDAPPLPALSAASSDLPKCIELAVSQQRQRQQQSVRCGAALTRACVTASSDLP